MSDHDTTTLAPGDRPATVPGRCRHRALRVPGVHPRRRRRLAPWRPRGRLGTRRPGRLLRVRLVGRGDDAADLRRRRLHRRHPRRPVLPRRLRRPVGGGTGRRPRVRRGPAEHRRPAVARHRHRLAASPCTRPSRPSSRCGTRTSSPSSTPSASRTPPGRTSPTWRRWSAPRPAPRCGPAGWTGWSAPRRRPGPSPPRRSAARRRRARSPAPPPTSPCARSTRSR